MGITLLLKDPNLYFMLILLVMFSICCHEYAHAQMALWQGDSTAADQGHLTLNPLKQMGIVSIIMLLFIGISWGAVPVNPSRMKHKYSHVLVSFAGPATNLILFVIFVILGSIAMIKGWKQEAVFMFLGGASLNIFLFILNMLPLPMLDGYTIFSHFIPKTYSINQELKNGLTFILVMAILAMSGKIMALGFAITQISAALIEPFLEKLI